MNRRGSGPRVLHVWNTAGVASVIAKFTDRIFGTSSKVITRKVADPVGLTTYGETYPDGPAVFYGRALWMGRRADIVHVHSLDRIVPWFKRVFSSKPVVLHYHGSDILERWGEKKDRWSCADLVVYSTPNLASGAPPRATHVPNPVDTDLFFPRKVARTGNSALSIRYGMDEEAEQVAKTMGLDLTWVERWSVRHEEMPPLLSRYQYFLDLRRPAGSPEAKSLGKAALEALACGCGVVDWSGRVVEGLPEGHLPDRVAARWYELYEGLLKG